MLLPNILRLFSLRMEFRFFLIPSLSVYGYLSFHSTSANNQISCSVSLVVQRGWECRSVIVGSKSNKKQWFSNFLFIHIFFEFTSRRLPNTVYEWHPEGRRKRGRPRHTLRRQYDRDLNNAEMSLQPRWEDVTTAAQLRDVWRGFVNALYATPGSGGSKVRLQALSDSSLTFGKNQNFGF